MNALRIILKDYFEFLCDAFVFTVQKEAVQESKFGLYILFHKWKFGLVVQLRNK